MLNTTQGLQKVDVSYCKPLSRKTAGRQSPSNKDWCPDITI